MVISEIIYDVHGKLDLLSPCTIIPLQLMAVLLVGLCLYDIFAVFITPIFTKVRKEGRIAQVTEVNGLQQGL